MHRNENDPGGPILHLKVLFLKDKRSGASNLQPSQRLFLTFLEDKRNAIRRVGSLNSPAKTGSQPKDQRHRDKTAI
jgi:hypothetical protein